LNGVLRVDQDRLGQVVDNLIANAIDATKDGKVAVEAEHDADGRQLLIRVKDTGGGVPGRMRARLFEPFATTKDSGMHFLRGAQSGRPDPSCGFSEEALHSLMTYDFPGNVRELRNMIERAVVLARGALITVEDLPPLGRSRKNDDSYFMELLELPLEHAVASLERRMIQRALERTKGNKAEAARILGINRQFLYSKLRGFSIG
jgi:hypothetical protein